MYTMTDLQTARNYLDRHGGLPAAIKAPPQPGLGLVIVIPCRDEPDLFAALESLWRCERPAVACEVLVVLNATADDGVDVRQQNQRTARAFIAWSTDHSTPELTFHLIDVGALPTKHAGVGLARKIGMDEAVQRLARVDRLDAPIAAFDADCGCATNYLQAVTDYFQSGPTRHACAIYFEHDLAHAPSTDLRNGITAYELYLRYYVHGLEYAGLPYAFHTVGSAMAVRAETYCRQGGMNRRQAGEDFYFLNKLAYVGRVDELTGTAVYPAARVSHRVPFGTGRALAEWQTQDQSGLLVYHPDTFNDLRQLVDRATAFAQNTSPPTTAFLDGLPSALTRFLTDLDGVAAIDECRRHSTSARTFKQRFFRWFDGFRAMKFARYARAEHYPPMDVREAALELLRRRGLQSGLEATADSAALLAHYRRLDRAPTSVATRDCAA